jgi:hypothetical protein
VRCLVLATVLCGCGPSGVGDLHLGWRFADGRRCADAGVATLFLADRGTPIGEPAGYPCESGEQGATVVVHDLPLATRALTAEAHSSAGAVLYRGDLALGNPFPDPAIVTLAFSGGK